MTAIVPPNRASWYPDASSQSDDLDQSCGEYGTKTPSRELFYRVCANAQEQDIRLEIELRVRDGNDEEASKIVVPARRASSFQIQDTKITVRPQ